jgi:hypothetical protein
MISNLSEADLNANLISQMPKFFLLSIDNATKQTHKDQHMAY